VDISYRPAANGAADPGDPVRGTAAAVWREGAAIDATDFAAVVAAMEAVG
jgi:hypothetical protein